MDSNLQNEGRYVFRKRYGHKMYKCPLCGALNGENRQCKKCGAILVKKPFPVRKVVIISIIALIPVFYLVYGMATGNCINDWHIQLSKDTCAKDSICLVCGKVLEKAKGHVYPQDTAKCAENILCSVCKKHLPPLTEHQWKAATCDSPYTCSICGKEKYGSVLGHDFVNGKCSRCGFVDYGIWKESYYLDKYGDKTDEQYIYAYSKGTFSNSATTNSKLEIKMLFDLNSSAIMLWEYESNKVKNPSSKNELYKIYAKNESGKEIETTGTLKSDGDRIFIDGRKSIYNILSEGGTVKFVIENINWKVEKYSFSIDANGFKYLWDKHWVWK